MYVQNDEKLPSCNVTTVFFCQLVHTDHNVTKPIIFHHPALARRAICFANDAHISGWRAPCQPIVLTRPSLWLWYFSTAHFATLLASWSPISPASHESTCVDQVTFLVLQHSPNGMFTLTKTFFSSSKVRRDRKLLHSINDHNNYSLVFFMDMSAITLNYFLIKRSR